MRNSDYFSSDLPYLSLPNSAYAVNEQVYSLSHLSDLKKIEVNQLPEAIRDIYIAGRNPAIGTETSIKQLFHVADHYFNHTKNFVVASLKPDSIFAHYLLSFKEDSFLHSSDLLGRFSEYLTQVALLDRPEEIQSALQIFPPSNEDLACLPGTSVRLHKAMTTLGATTQEKQLINWINDFLDRESVALSPAFVPSGSQIHIPLSLKKAMGMETLDHTAKIDQFFRASLATIPLDTLWDIRARFTVPYFDYFNTQYRATLGGVTTYLQQIDTTRKQLETTPQEGLTKLGESYNSTADELTNHYPAIDLATITNGVTGTTSVSSALKQLYRFTEQPACRDINASLIPYITLFENSTHQKISRHISSESLTLRSEGLITLMMLGLDIPGNNPFQFLHTIKRIGGTIHLGRNRIEYMGVTPLQKSYCKLISKRCDYYLTSNDESVKHAITIISGDAVEESDISSWHSLTASMLLTGAPLYGIAQSLQSESKTDWLSHDFPVSGPGYDSRRSIGIARQIASRPDILPLLDILERKPCQYYRLKLLGELLIIAAKENRHALAAKVMSIDTSKIDYSSKSYHSMEITPLCWAIKLNRHEMIGTLLSALSPDERVAKLKTEIDGITFFDYAMFHGQPAAITALLAQIPATSRLEVISNFGSSIMNSLHYTTIHNKHEHIRAFRGSLSEGDWLELIQKRKSSNKNTIHIAAAKGYVESIHALLDGMDEHAHATAIIQVVNERNSIDIATDSPNCELTIAALLHGLSDYYRLFAINHSLDNLSPLAKTIDNNNIRALRPMLAGFSPEGRLKVLAAKCNDITMLNRIVDSNDPELAAVLFESLRHEGLLGLLNERDANDSTVLHRAAKKGKHHVITALLQDLSSQEIIHLLTLPAGANQVTALHEAAKDGHAAAITEMLEHRTADERLLLITMKDNQGYTVLSYGIQHPQIMKSLLSGLTAGIQKNLLISPLYNHILITSSYGSSETVTMLLRGLSRTQQWTAVNAKNQYGSALSIARNTGNFPVFCALIARQKQHIHDIALMQYNSNGRTLLHEMARQGYSESIPIMSATVTNQPRFTSSMITQKDANGLNVFDHALAGGHLKTAAILFQCLHKKEKLAWLTKPLADGMTLLHHMAKNEEMFTIFRPLLPEPIPKTTILHRHINTADTNGYTARQLAVRYHNNAANDYLQQMGGHAYHSWVNSLCLSRCLNRGSRHTERV